MSESHDHLMLVENEEDPRFWAWIMEFCTANGIDLSQGYTEDMVLQLARAMPLEFRPDLWTLQQRACAAMIRAEVVRLGYYPPYLQPVPSCEPLDPLDPA